MAAQIKQLIPTDELTLTDKATFRRQAIERGIARAVAVKAIAGPDQCVVRHADPVADFGMAAGGWLTNALAVVGTQYSVFNALTPTLANNRVAVFYAVAIETFPIPVNILAFREGAVAGTTYAQFDLEQLVTMQQQLGYFSEPVVYDPQRVLNVVATCRIATAAAARVWMGCYIIEPGGPVISA